MSRLNLSFTHWGGKRDRAVSSMVVFIPWLPSWLFAAGFGQLLHHPGPAAA